MKTLDELRAKYPHLGVALYAYDPGKPVTLELIAPDGKSYSFKGATETAAIAAAGLEDDVEATPPVAPAPTADVFA